MFSSELSSFVQSDILDNMTGDPSLHVDSKGELISLGAALNLFRTVLPVPHVNFIWSLSDMEGVLPMGRVAFDTTASPTHAFHKSNRLLKATQCEPFSRAYTAWTVFERKISDARLAVGG